MELRCSYSKRPLRCLLAACLGLPFTIALADEKSQDSVGVVSFDIGCSESSQSAMNRAVALLHNMMYVEAEAIFNEAVESEPDCAMLYWGVATTNFHPMWPGSPSNAEIVRDRAAIEQALSQGGGNDRENAYIQAAANYYEGADDTKTANRVAAWAEGQKAVHEKFPDDVDATAFFALSHLAVAPRGDKTLKSQKEAGMLLETLHAQNPEHPAGFHYLIHAYDNPLLASKAESVANAYNRLAPNVPHALHMPSHIFVRMGLWNETIFWNDRSAKAALDNVTDDVTSSHYAHARDYKIYAHLQRGETDLAATDLKEMTSVANHQKSFGAAYALAAAPARMYLEVEDWEGAANLPDELHSAIDWSGLPAVVAINHFAQGIGAARSSDLEKAIDAEAKLDALRTRLTAEGPAYWETQVESQHLSVQGWIAFAKGEMEEAEQLMMNAAEAEDSVGKSPVTPGAVLPARELYGDMLSLMGKHEQALEAYETALKVSPNRTRSLRGAMNAADALGDKKKATMYKQAQMTE